MEKMEMEKFKNPNKRSRLTTGFRDKIKDPVYRRKLVHTIMLWVSYVFLGVRSTMHPPAFMDFAQITGVDLVQASVFYTAMAVGALSGTAVMALMYDKLPNWRTFFIPVCNLGSAVTTSSLPWSTNFYLTIFIFVANAIFNAAFDAAVVPDMMSTWGVDGKMVVLFLHFSYAAGTIVSPLIVKPFLAERTHNASFCNALSGDDQTHLINMTMTSGGSVLDNTTTSECVYSESRIHYAYLIGGLLSLVSAILIGTETYVQRKEITTGTYTENHRNPRKLTQKLHALVLLFLGGIYFFHVAAAATVIGFFMPFVVEDRNWTKGNAANWMSGFSAAFALTRLVGTFIIRFVSPSNFMLSCNVILTLSLVAMWICVQAGNDLGIGVTFVLYALGLSGIYPTGIVLLEHDFVKIRGLETAVIQLSANVPGISDPPLTGYLLQNVSMKWYVYFSFIETIIGVVSFILLKVTHLTLIKRHDKRVSADQEKRESNHPTEEETSML